MGPETLNQTVLNTTHALIYCIHGLLPLRDRDIPILLIDALSMSGTWSRSSLRCLSGWGIQKGFMSVAWYRAMASVPERGHSEVSKCSFPVQYAGFWKRGKMCRWGVWLLLHQLREFFFGRNHT